MGDGDVEASDPKVDTPQDDANSSRSEFFRGLIKKVVSTEPIEQRPFIPADLGVTQESAESVEKIVSSWESEPTDEARLAKDMVMFTLREVDAWIPGENKYMKPSRDAKQMRDLLVADQLDLPQKVWETTISGRLEAIREHLKKQSFLSRLVFRMRSDSADLREAEGLVDKNERDQMSWEQVVAGCVVTNLQKPTPYVRRGIIKSLELADAKLGIEIKTEVYGKALDLVDAAIKPIRPELLYSINKAIGPSPM